MLWCLAVASDAEEVDGASEQVNVDDKDGVQQGRAGQTVVQVPGRDARGPGQGARRSQVPQLLLQRRFLLRTKKEMNRAPLIFQRFNVAIIPRKHTSLLCLLNMFMKMKTEN